MDLKEIYQNVVDGQAADVEAGVKAALAAGVPASDILSQALIAAMDEVGQRYEEGDLFVPEMLIAARAMQAGLRILKPLPGRQMSKLLARWRLALSRATCTISARTWWP